MSKTIRVTLTRNQAATAYGSRLINQILAMSRDGIFEVAEVKALHELLRAGPVDFNAVQFLRAVTTEILVDDRLDEFESYRLRRAMERVVPKHIRGDISELLSRSGLPADDPDDEEDPFAPRMARSWYNDPITAKQFDYILALGGTPTENMTKGEASRAIDRLLHERPPTPRQQMVLRFFDRLDLMRSTKEEVGVWLDDLYIRNEEFERAWHRFKLEIGDDGTIRDPNVVPIGAFRRYLHKKNVSTPRPPKPNLQPTAFSVKANRRAVHRSSPLWPLLAIAGALFLLGIAGYLVIFAR